MEQALSRKQRKKLNSAQKLTGQVEVVGYSSAIGNVRMSNLLIGLIVGFCILFAVVLVLAHVVVYPGGVLLIVVAGLLQPRRGVAVTPWGVVVMHESMVNALPSRILLSLPFTAFDMAAPGKSRRVRIQLGNERLRMKVADYRQLVAAIESLPVGHAAGPSPYWGPQTPTNPAGWHPDPVGRHQFRFWDGSAWTPHVANGGSPSLDPLPSDSGTGASPG